MEAHARASIETSYRASLDHAKCMYRDRERTLSAQPDDSTSEDEETKEQAIKTMKLYGSGRQAFMAKELNDRNISLDNIKVSDVVQFLCMNYTGTQGSLDGVKPFNLSSKSKVLDLGSGLGGPCLQIADSIGCEVVGVELQEDVAACARDIAKRCKVEGVTFVASDILEMDRRQEFDALISVLCVLHIPVSLRSQLFNKVNSLLASDGKIYIEDYFLQKDQDGKSCVFSETELKILADDVAVPNGQLPTQEEYIATLTECGFTDIKFCDVTTEWTAYTTNRLAEWNTNKNRLVRVHGSKTWEDLEYFYRSVVVLFSGNKLGGCRLWATKKA